MNTRIVTTLAVSLAFAGWLSQNSFAQDALPKALQSSAPAPRGLAVAPVLKTSTTVLGQKIEYAKTENPEVSSVVQTYQPGGETGWHYHLLSSHIYVLEGALTLEMADGSTREFAAGRAYMESVKTWHNARNTGTTPLKLLVVTFGENQVPNNVFGKADK